MAGGKERTLRRRIKSVQATKKITKAMELIAASRILKAQQRVTAARPYSEQITAVIGNLAAAGASGGSPLLEQRAEIHKVAFVAVAADRGLCGGYNANVIRAVDQAMRAERAEGRDPRLVTIGKKAMNYFRFRGVPIDEAFTGMSDTPSYENARAVAELVVGRFEAGEYDGVQLVYTQFLSAATQRVVNRPFMPLDPAVLGIERVEGPHADYEFEPAPDEILTRLLPRYAEARLYAALLEGAASFFAAQQRAMKSATDNAEDLITRYTRAMNRARQDSITTEIMEIVGGAEAMRQAQSGEVDLLPDRALLPEHFMPERLGEHHRRFEHTRK
jgi:F-type H+-transporting ATPase subunit gamma